MSTNLFTLLRHFFRIHQTQTSDIKKMTIYLYDTIMTMALVTIVKGHLKTNGLDKVQ